MSEPRLRILSVVPGNPKTYTGCEYHRQLVPHHHLGKHYPCDIFQVDTIGIPTPINVGGEMMTIEELAKTCHVVHFGRLIDSFTHDEIILQKEHQWQTKETADMIHSWGLPIILDLDDYWKLSSKHILKNTFAHNKQDYYMMLSAKYADHVTVTTPFLAEKVSEVNKSVSILPNAIDPDMNSRDISPELPDLKQWTKVYKPDPQGRLRFGWVGGACHVEDFECCHTGFSKIWHDADVSGNFQVILGGYNLNDQSYVKEGNGYVLKKTPGDQCVYTRFERMLTDDYKGFAHTHPNYTNYLTLYTSHMSGSPDVYEMPYRREWSVDTYSYGQKYNEWDVTFIPLNDNEFNNSKSQLKMIESGFMGKACIVSGVLPYTYDAVHMENAWVVPPNKNHKGWNKAMKAMIHDRDMVKTLAANLEADMKDKYHIDRVNRERFKVYCTVAGMRKTIQEKYKAA